MKNLTTHEMAIKFGVTPRALRHYDALGLLLPMRCGAARIFTPADQDAMSLIERGKAIGLTLEEIRAFMADDTKALAVPSTVIHRLSAEAHRKRDEALAAIDTMHKAQDVAGKFRFEATA